MSSARSQSDEEGANFLHQEICSMMSLAVATLVVQWGVTLPRPFVLGVVGRTYGSVHMDGVALAQMTANLFTLSYLGGLYSAADTLSPPAVAAGNLRRVGQIAVTGFTMSLVLIFPVNCLLVIYTPTLLRALGQDSDAAHYAGLWYTVYAATFPLISLYMAIWKFLSAQHMMRPLMIACFVSCLVVLPCSLVFFMAQFGFVGAAYSLAVYQTSQVGILLTWLWWVYSSPQERQHREEPHRTSTQTTSWFLSWQDTRRYISLGTGGILASSEFLYWEILSLGVGRLGVVPLAVHAIPTQVLIVTFLVPASVSTALAVRMGVLLPRNVYACRRLVWCTWIGGVTVAAVMAIVLHACRDWMIGWYTTDPAVVEGCHRIWWKVSIFLFSLWIYAMNSGIAIGLGMQWTLGVVTLVCLWGLGFPTAWIFGVANKSLETFWTWLIPPYIMMNVMLSLAFVFKDWASISQDIRRRENIPEESASIHVVELSVHSPSACGVPIQEAETQPFF